MKEQTKQTAAAAEAEAGPHLSLGDSVCSDQLCTHHLSTASKRSRLSLGKHLQQQQQQEQQQQCLAQLWQTYASPGAGPLASNRF
jgi:hypothetical protein